jgi:ubiquinone/menaquinone biosynthesis C-methylase UbiE
MVAQRFFRQFGRPSGLLGRVAARMMVRMNGPLNGWAVELLELSPRDRLLEIGFGTGLAVERAAALLCEGHVAGIDHSDLMRGHAARRNRAAVAAGRVDLRVGTAGSLPWGDAGFTRALAVNSLQFWPDVPGALAELHRVLAPGGRLVLALRMRNDRAGRYDRSRHGMSEQRLAQVMDLVAGAGFGDVREQRREIRGEAITAILARASGGEASHGRSEA